MKRIYFIEPGVYGIMKDESAVHKVECTLDQLGVYFTSFDINQIELPYEEAKDIMEYNYIEMGASGANDNYGHTMKHELYVKLAEYIPTIVAAFEEYYKEQGWSIYGKATQKLYLSKNKGTLTNKGVETNIYYIGYLNNIYCIESTRIDLFRNISKVMSKSEEPSTYTTLEKFITFTKGKDETTLTYGDNVISKDKTSFMYDICMLYEDYERKTNGTNTSTN